MSHVTRKWYSGQSGQVTRRLVNHLRDSLDPQNVGHETRHDTKKDCICMPGVFYIDSVLPP